MMWANAISHFDGSRWQRDAAFEQGLQDQVQHQSTRLSELGRDTGVRLLDLDGDGVCEVVICLHTGPNFSWSTAIEILGQTAVLAPAGANVTDGSNDDWACASSTSTSDGKLDVIFSNEKEYGIYLFTDMKHGWSRRSWRARPATRAPCRRLRSTARTTASGSIRGQLWWQNENTDLLKDLVDRRSFNDLLDERRADRRSRRRRR